MIEFEVTQWSAWASGLERRSDWQNWARQPFLPTGDATPPLLEVPAMQRRRIDRLGRIALQAAWWCADAQATDLPLIFVSRHGDVARSCELLEQLSRDEPMSPTQFGLSVHNAVAALYSIVRGEHGNCLALAGGRASAEIALIEAVGLLEEGAKEVQVVMYDVPLPDLHAQFVDEPEAGYAWSWRIRTAKDKPGLTLDWRADDPDSELKPGALPAGLAPLGFFLGDQTEYVNRVDGLRWRWHRGS